MTSYYAEGHFLERHFTAQKPIIFMIAMPMTRILLERTENAYSVIGGSLVYIGGVRRK